MAKNLKFMTLDVQGLRNIKKRKTLFRLIREDKISFVVLQETYITNEDLNILQKEWPGTIHLSADTRGSKGLITIFDKKIEEKNIKHIESKERYILSEIKVEDRSIMVINAHAPRDDKGKINFLTELFNAVYENMNTYSEIIYLGDFNVVSDNILDIISGNKHNQNMVEMFKNWMNCQNVGDCWREHHPTEKKFTWSRGNIARRLDYILLDPILESKVINTSIKTLVSQIIERLYACYICKKKKKKKEGGGGGGGRSHYKLNTNLLKD